MTGRTRRRAAAAGLCAGLLLGMAAPAGAQERAASAPALAATQGSDRDALLRLLAEEMTTRLVTALSIQARSHAAEVATLEYRLRQAEERLAKGEAEQAAREAAQQRELAGMRDLLARAEAALGGIGASQSAMQRALQTREEDVSRLKAALTGALAGLSEARQEVRQARFAAGEANQTEIAELRGRVDTATTSLDGLRGELRSVVLERDRLAAESEELRAEQARVQLDRDIAVGERDALSDRLEQVASRVAGTGGAQSGGLEAQALQRLGQIEQFLSSTGVDVSRLSQPIPAKGAVVPPPLPVSRQAGRGGPFIPYGNVQVQPVVAKPDPQLERHLDRLERIERILRVVPIGAPLAHYSFESGFGQRSDPFRKKAAMHEGVDLAAPARTPLRATAPGTVVFAGRKGAYGKTVDVRHHGGIVTRYAHMADIQATVGDAVARGDVVGLLGSTGRSTGPHVHYEVIIDGQPVDPARLIGRK